MKSILYIFLIICPSWTSAQIKVSLFNSFPVKGLVISAYDGNFVFYYGEEKLEEFSTGKIFYVTLYEKKLLLNDVNGSLGWYEDLTIKPQSDSSKLKIMLIDPKEGERFYTGSIQFKIEYGRILILNEINPENYIAGVVEAESGINAMPEFYKAQALLCRTYLFSHLSRHESEGFNLCDEVHCQAYKGFNPFTSHIFRSTSTTTGKVIVDANKQLITAAFHANCGGKTESAFNIWLKPENYLISVTDPYCIKTHNANWEKKIPLNDWKKYLNSYGIKAYTMPATSMEMKKNNRQIYYRAGKDSILTKQIRTDWNLKSSFFQLQIKNNTVFITGHGYGHGVGLCQDGAMNMAKKGCNYEEIINFYFRKVNIRGIQ